MLASLGELSPVASPEDMYEDPRITAAVALVLRECLPGKLTLYCPGPGIDAGLAEVPEVRTIYVDNELCENNTLEKTYGTKIAPYSERRLSRWHPGELIDAICFFPPRVVDEADIVSTTPLAAGALVAWAGHESERPHFLQDRSDMTLIGTVPTADGESGLTIADAEGYFIHKTYGELTGTEKAAFQTAMEQRPEIGGNGSLPVVYKQLQGKPGGITFTFPYRCNEPALFVYRRMPAGY